MGCIRQQVNTVSSQVVFLIHILKRLKKGDGISLNIFYARSRFFCFWKKSQRVKWKTGTSLLNKFCRSEHLPHMPDRLFPLAASSRKPGCWKTFLKTSVRSMRLDLFLVCNLYFFITAMNNVNFHLKLDGNTATAAFRLIPNWKRSGSVWPGLFSRSEKDQIRVTYGQKK